MSKIELPPQYLRGVELFNAGEYFACHETLEEIWLTAQGVEREFLHALIQTAAALHHWRRGNVQGARSVYERARRKLEGLPPVLMQLAVQSFQQQLDQYFSTTAAEQAVPPQIALLD
jgi:hypothetical protein